MLIFPGLAGLYAKATPLAETALRVVAGALLALHGFPKLMAPLGASEMVAGIGFPAPAFFSVLLSFGEFFAGVFLLLGLFTRPAALVATVILAVAAYTHWVVWQQGLTGAELALIWAFVTLYFTFAGGNKYSVDKVIGKEV